MFCEKSMCYSVFWKILFILILIKSSLDSWILNLESWSWFLNSTFFLNLEVFFNFFFLSLELFLIPSWTSLTHPLIDLRAFCNHLCHHLLLSSLLSSKHLWITFDSPWSFASTTSNPLKARMCSSLKVRTCSPLKARACSPLKVRTCSPLKARACSPLMARMCSPLRARMCSPLKARTYSPLNVRACSPLMARMCSPLRVRVLVPKGPPLWESKRLTHREGQSSQIQKDWTVDVGNLCS